MKNLKDVINFNKEMKNRGYMVKFGIKGDVVCKKMTRDIKFDKNGLNLAKRILKRG